MKGMTRMMRKLAWLAMMALPFASVADLMSPAWDERVMVPVFNMPEWLLCGFVFAGFVIVSVLVLVAMRRKGRPVMEFVVLETMIAAALVGLLVQCKGCIKGCIYEERVIHHPEQWPKGGHHPEQWPKGGHHYDNSTIPGGACSTGL